MKIGHGLDPETEMGPLVSQEQFDKVTGYTSQSGRDQGAKDLSSAAKAALRTAATSSNPPSCTNVSPGMKVVDEEIFGPVVVAQKLLV